MSGGGWGPQGFAVLAAVLAALGFALMPVFVRELGLTGMAAERIAFFRFAIAAIVLLPFLSLRPRHLRATGAGMVTGVAVGFGFIAYIVTLKNMTIVAASVFYLSYPLFTLILAWVLINLVPETLTALSALLVAVAVWLLWDGTGVGRLGFTELAIAFGAPVSLAYAFTVRRGWLQQLGPLQRLSSVALGGTLALAPLALRHGVGDLVPDGGQLLLVLGLALASTAVPHIILTIAGPRIGHGKAAIAGGFEVPVVVLLGWGLYGQKAGVYELGAAALVLIALTLAAVSSHQTGRPPLA